jgi:hypothetical protein
MISPMDTEKRKWIKGAAVVGAAIAGGLVLPFHAGCRIRAAKGASGKSRLRSRPLTVTE